MLKFFNYSILKMRNELESVKASIKKDFYSNKINNYINSDEKIIVSSWGKKYIFDDTNANWTAKVKLKIHD